MGHPQSLSKGATGVAMLHIEHAPCHDGDWRTVHEWTRYACDCPIAAGPDTTLYFGAPALAFALHPAAEQGHYRQLLAALDTKVAAVTRQRLDDAHRRIDQSKYPALAEFDLINGLTGLGAHLLRRDPHGRLTRDVLTYLVRLTHPLGDSELPGWWTDQAPTGRRSSSHPGGHANHGMAHGISGPLALLALAARRGITIDGHTDAISRICAWLDHWRQRHESGHWWPETLSLDDLRRGQPAQQQPLRPSWCYGTPGLARAQQLAAHALRDHARERIVVQALTDCLDDPRQRRRIVDHSICHGTAGLLHTTRRIATDAAEPAAFTPHIRQLEYELSQAEHTDPGFLEGTSGTALAALAHRQLPASGWDTCLLVG